jgi:hypothetical protein
MGDERFDGVFMSIVQQSQGIDNFFDNLFGFMGRKTDFFTQETNALTIVTKALTRNMELFKKEHARKEALERKQAEQRAKEELARKQEQAKKQEKESAQVVEVTDEEAARIEAEEKAKKSGQPVAEVKEENKEEGENKGQKPNAGNGGRTDLYHWEQTLKDVTVYVKIPQGLTGKNLVVKMGNNHLRVDIKGQPGPLIDKDFCKTIKLDDSLWTLESDANGERCLQLLLTKKEGQNWWDCVFVGDEKIDT